MKIKSWVEAPRYAHFASSLRKYAIKMNFEIKITVDKELFFETIFWEADGTEEQMSQFKTDWNHFVGENT